MALTWSKETHLRIRAICNRSTRLEYQLKIADMELAGVDDIFLRPKVSGTPSWSE